MIKFKDKNIIVLLHRWNNLQVELCIFKPNQHVKWHMHKFQDIEVMHLWGYGTYRRKDKDRGYRATFKDMFKKFSIPANIMHSAYIGGCGIITLSIQRWNTVKPTSVINDFILWQHNR